MDGVKSEMVTWAVGRGTARTWMHHIHCRLNSCTIIADAFATVAKGSGVGKGYNSGG
jgi:hypothetical protein